MDLGPRRREGSVFFGVRVMICWGGAQMAAAVSRFNKVSPASVPARRRRREARVSGVVSRISFSAGVLRIIDELFYIDISSFFFVSGTDVIF